MEWLESLQKALDFIENNITDTAELTSFEVANEVFSSEYNFRRIFSVITGYTVGEYIRNRRLSLAGEELIVSNVKIIDLAVKYGYDTAESFTKAFTRFHGITPSAMKKSKSGAKSFSRIMLKIEATGGTMLDYSFEVTAPIYIAGYNKIFPPASFEQNSITIPEFVKECCDKSFDKLMSVSADNMFKGCVLGYRDEIEGNLRFTFGVSCSESHSDDELTITKIPPCKWIKFKCIENEAKAMQKLWYRIYTEIMPFFSYKLADNITLEVSSVQNNVNEKYLLIPIRQN